jgi:hypothetical protein
MKWRKRMRDKVLCRGWTGQNTVCAEDTFFLVESNLHKDEQFLILSSIFTLLSGTSVPVSIQGGVKMKMKMSIDEFLGFFDFNTTRMNQKTRRKFLERVSRRELDTIHTADSLFRGTVVDFGDLVSHSGGVTNAKHDFAVN